MSFTCFRCGEALSSRGLYPGYHDACAAAVGNVAEFEREKARRGLVAPMPFVATIVPATPKPRQKKKTVKPVQPDPVGGCHFCGREFVALRQTKDHLLPQSRGGTDAKTNLVWACWPCNQAKGARTEAEFASWIALVYSHFIEGKPAPVPVMVDQLELHRVSRDAYQSAPPRWDDQQGCSLHTGVEAAATAAVTFVFKVAAA